jgi:hypothetical protein
MPELAESLQMPDRLGQGDPVQMGCQDAAALRGERPGPQQEPEQRILAHPGQLTLHQVGREAAVPQLQVRAAVVRVPDAGPEQDHVAHFEFLPPGQALVAPRAARDHGDLEEAVGVDRMAGRVQVRAGVGDGAVDEVQQRAGVPDRRILHAST